MSNIEGKVVVITGASSGLGEATARLLARGGAKVFLGARRKERLSALVADLERAGAQEAAKVVDVTKRAEVEAFVQAALRQFGRIDVLVNNAGLMAQAPLAKTLVDEWDRVIDTNIKGVLYGIAAALPIFQRQNGGHFVNIASVAGLKVSMGAAVYAATKPADVDINEVVLRPTAQEF
jgi:NADP-dependent 3-hydroxy acid dehydrogenase YdfG